MLHIVCPISTHVQFPSQSCHPRVLSLTTCPVLRPPRPTHLPLYPELWKLPSSALPFLSPYDPFSAQQGLHKMHIRSCHFLHKPLQSLPKATRITFQGLTMVLKSHKTWIRVYNRIFSTLLSLADHTGACPPPTAGVRPPGRSAEHAGPQ